MVDEDPPDLGGIGEHTIATWASEVGIVANPVRKDATGWDYIFELRHPPSAQDSTNPLDQRPPEMTCFVQVKATRNLAHPIDVKLSNWERLAKRPIPAFFIVIGIDDRNKASDAYLVHVGTAWVEKTLRRLRQVPLDKQGELHHMTMQLIWTADERLPELSGRAMIQALRHAVGSDLLAYVREKGRWLDTLGYDERPFRVSVSFPVTDDFYERMADFAIGRVKQLPVELGDVRRVRFGSEELVQPKHKGESFMSLPEIPSVGAATVEVADSTTGEVVRLRCSIRRARRIFPFLPAEHDKVAFVCDIATFVVMPWATPATGRASMSWTFHVPTHEDRVKLTEAADAARLTRILGAPDGSPVVITVVVDGRSHRFPTTRSNASIDPDILEYSMLVLDTARIAVWCGLPSDLRVHPSLLHHQGNNISLIAALLNGNTEAEATASVEKFGEPRTDGTRAAVVVAPFVNFEDYVLVVVAAIVGIPFRGDSPSSIKVKGLARVMTQRVVPFASAQQVDARRLSTEAAAQLEEEGIAPVILDSALIDESGPQDEEEQVT